MTISLVSGTRSLLLAVVFWTFAGSSFTMASERVALVIGNNAYTHARPLKSAVADAEAMAARLENDLGFQVITRVTEKTRTSIPRTAGSRPSCFPRIRAMSST